MPLSFLKVGSPDSRRVFVRGHFGPKKKIFTPPPPKNSPIRCRHPPGRLAPPALPPPLLGFSIKKPTPPPHRRLRLPLPPPRAEKKYKKYPKRPPSFVGENRTGAHRPLKRTTFFGTSVDTFVGSSWELSWGVFELRAENWENQPARVLSEADRRPMLGLQGRGSRCGG